MESIDPPALAAARDFLRNELGRQLATEWRGAFDGNQTPGPYSPAPGPAGQRALKNQAIGHLIAAAANGDRKSVVSGKSVSVRVDPVRRRIITNKNKKHKQPQFQT